MKKTIILLCSLIGCASPPSGEVAQAAKRYQAINWWMSQDEVYRLLGQPQTILADGRQQWSVSDGQNSATLWLRIGSDGKISEMEQRSRLH